MDTVIGSGKPDHHHLDFEQAAEIRHDRDGTTHSDQGRLLLPFVVESSTCAQQPTSSQRSRDPGITFIPVEEDLTIRGQLRDDDIPDGLANPVRVLPLHQPERVPVPERWTIRLHPGRRQLGNAAHAQMDVSTHKVLKDCMSISWAPGQPASPT